MEVIKETVNVEYLTYEEWLAAAARPASPEKRRAWLAGEDPTEYRCTVVDDADYVKALTKMLGRRLKKDMGALSAQLNYVGTGSQAARRQLYVRFPATMIDLWIERTEVKLGGCTQLRLGKVAIPDDDVEGAYRLVRDALRAGDVTNHGRGY